MPYARIARTRLDEQRAEERAEEKVWRDVCREVSARDGYACRCCGRSCVQSLRRQENRLEHHHVIPRSLGGTDESWNLCVLCLACHEDRHVKRTLHITGNANELLSFDNGERTWQS